MISCPNKNLQEWKDLVDEVGEDLAYFKWNQTAIEVSAKKETPTSFESDLLSTDFFFKKYGDIRIKHQFYTQALNYLNANYAGYYRVKPYSVRGVKGRTIYYVEEVKEGLLFNNEVSNVKPTSDAREIFEKVFNENNGVHNNSDIIKKLLELGWVREDLIPVAKMLLNKVGNTQFIKALPAGVFMHYVHDTQMIELASNSLKNKAYFVESYLHEVLHHYTALSLKNPITEEEKRFAKEIQVLYQQALSLFKNDKQYYGLTDIYEFVAELCTDREFVKAIQTKKLTLWQKILKVFGRLFSGSKIYNNAIEKIENFISYVNKEVNEAQDRDIAFQQMFSNTGEVSARKSKKFTGAPTMEEKEDIIPRYIKDITEQVKRLEDLIRPGKTVINTQIRGEISKLKERIKSLEDGQTSDALIDYAQSDINDIVKKLEGFQDMNLEDKRRFFFTAMSYLETWKNLNKLLRFGDKVIDNKINSISGLAIATQNNMFELYKDFYNQYYASPSNPLTADFFSSQVDSSILETLMLNLGINDIPVIRQIYDLLQRANFKAADSTEMDHELIDRETETLLKWAKKNNVSEKELWDMFAQKRKNGDYTDGLIHEISQDYYEELSRLNQEIYKHEFNTPAKLQAIKERNDFFDANTDTIINEEAWQKELDAAKLRYTDEDGNLDTKKFSYWFSLYNPRGTGDMRYKRSFVKVVPKKELWYDKRFAKIENTPELNRYYNEVIKKIIDAKLEFLPYVPDYKANFLPELLKSSLLGFKDKEGALKGFKRGAFDIFTVKIADNVTSSTTNPITGELEKQIPVYMIYNRLRPDQKERDLSKVLKAFSSMANLYRYKEEISEDVLILRGLLNDVFEHVRTATGENLISGVTNRYVRKKINTLAKVKEALDYAIDYSLFDIRKNAPDVGVKVGVVENKYGEKEARGFSFTKLFDSMIVLTRRKGMGLNVFASTVNLAFGIMTNMIEGNGEQYFTSEQASKALYKMLYTTMTAGKSEESKKILLLMDKFRVLKDFADISLENSLSIKNKVDKVLFYLQEKSELFIHGQTFIAMLLNTPIVNLKGEKKSVYDAYIMKDGKLTWDTENFGEEAYTNMSEGKYEFMKNMNRVIERLHGDYNPDNPKLYNKTIIGRILMVFRAWIPQSAYARFGKEKTIDGVTTKGRLRSFGAYFDQEGVSKMQGMGQMLADIGKEFTSQFLNFMLIARKGSGVKFNTFSKLNAVDQQNMRRNVAAMRYTLSMLGLMLLLAGIDVDDDDEKGKTTIKFLMNETFRIQNDLSFFLNPSAQQSILRDIVPLGGTIADFGDVFDATIRLFQGEDELKTGPNAGKSNWIRQFNQNIPVLNQAQKLIELADAQVAGYN